MVGGAEQQLLLLTASYHFLHGMRMLYLGNDTNGHLELNHMKHVACLAIGAPISVPSLLLYLFVHEIRQLSTSMHVSGIIAASASFPFMALAQKDWLHCFLACRGLFEISCLVGSSW